MIKLVASDLDGTLLQYGKMTIEGEIFDQIDQFARRGILFCPASGRQYNSLKKLFAPVAQHCVFLCENGSVIFKEDKVLAKTPMPRALALQIAEDLWQGCEEKGEVMLSGENTSYLMVRDLGMERRIRSIGNAVELVQNPADIPEDILKVSLYLPGGVEPFVQRFVPKWKEANAAVAGPFWIDTTVANKGTGIRTLCKALGLTPAQVMAFGDNYNDEAMLDIVGTPYIMDTAAEPLRQKYKNHAKCPEDVLRDFLAR